MKRQKINYSEVNIDFVEHTNMREDRIIHKKYVM